MHRKSSKIRIVFSVDDGSQYDLELADLLLKYNIPAVFYIPQDCELTEGQIQALSGMGTCIFCKDRKRLFDIGCHTLTHPQDLKKLTDKELWNEIKGAKDWLEKLIERLVTKFAYPRGRFDERVKNMVKKAGFKEARTTKVLSIDFPDDPFETNTTIHIHPDRKEYNEKSWNEIGFELFDKVIENGGRFEIWGHGWEIEKYNMWEFVEDFLAYMDDKMKEINYPRKIDIPYYELK